ncbi:MAG: hypothetical protein ABIY55_10255 [Kofleriaceae bacterium]
MGRRAPAGRQSVPCRQRRPIASFDPRKLRAAGRARPELTLGFCFDDGMLDFARHLLDRLPPLAADFETDDRRPGHNARRMLRRILGADLIDRWIAARVVGAEHTLIGGQTVRQLHRQGIAIGTHTLFPIGSTMRPSRDAGGST